MHDTPAEPTGHPFVLRSADQRVTAEITQVGAALRALTVDDVDLVPRYPSGIPTPAAAGVVLVPWPNRIRDGRWSQGETEHQLAITEPRTGNASHGLLRFTPYIATELTAERVTLAATVFPQSGYPFHLDTSVTYALTDMGLEVSHMIRNVGAEWAPVAVGTHPYLSLGDVPIDELTLQIEAETFFTVDDRLLPVDEVAVQEHNDLRTPRRIGDLILDTAYAQLRAGDDGRVRGVLTAPDGRSVELWAGPGFGYLQVYTADTFPGHGRAVAVEPMTAPADAFNSGRNLRWLEPGESWPLHWGITYSGN